MPDQVVTQSTLAPQMIKYITRFEPKYLTILNKYPDKVNKMLEGNVCYWLSGLFLFAIMTSEIPNPNNEKRRDYEWFQKNVIQYSNVNEPDSDATDFFIHSLYKEFTEGNGRRFTKEEEFLDDGVLFFEEKFSIAGIMTPRKLRLLLETLFKESGKFGFDIGSHNHRISFYKGEQLWYYDSNINAAKAEVLSCDSNIFALLTEKIFKSFLAGEITDETWGVITLKVYTAKKMESINQNIEGVDVATFLGSCMSVEVNTKQQSFTFTGIHIAAAANCVASLNYYLSKKNTAAALLNLECGRGRTTALAEAIARGYDAIVKILLNTPEIKLQTSSEDDHPLFAAAFHGYANIVKYFLSRPNICVDAKSAEGHLPLVAAAGAGHDFVVKLFIEHHKEEICMSGSDGYTPALMAAQNGHITTLQLLLDANADPNTANADKFTALMSTVSKGHTSCVKLLLEKKALVNVATDTGQTALHTAGAFGATDIMEILLNAGANIHALMQDKTPLAISAQYNNLKSVTFLLEKKADINGPGMPPIYLAIVDGKKEAAELLLQRKAFFGFIINDKLDLLSIAILNGYESIAILLMTYGLTPDRTEKLSSNHFSNRSIPMERVKTIYKTFQAFQAMHKEEPSTVGYLANYSQKGYGLFAPPRVTSITITPSRVNSALQPSLLSN